MMYKLDAMKLKNSRGFFENKPSGGHALYILSMTALIIVGLVWSGVAKIDDLLKAPATLRPVGTVSSLRCLTGGELLEKRWFNDQQVKVGDTLWVIDTKLQKIELENSTLSLEQTQKDIENTLFLEQSILAGRNIISPVNNDAYLLVETYFSEYTRQQSLLSQTGKKLERERQMPENMRTPQTANDLEAELLQQRSSFLSWLSNQKQQIKDQLKALRKDERSLRGNIASVKRSIEESIVVAPIAGRVIEVKKVNEGDTVMASEEILRIVPQNDMTLKAEIYIEPTRIGRVKPGQIVKLRFSGLPPAEYGQLKAIISVVPSDVTQVGNSGFFVVEAYIPNAILTSSSGEEESIHLKPGMTAEARIILSQKTALRLILNKLNFVKR